MMLVLVALKDWHISRLDVKTAFLYGELDEELYMEHPEGFKIPGQQHKVMHLKCAIYGLKQAALAWWKALDKSMAALGCTRLLSDSGLFVNEQKTIVVIIYVDDVCYVSTRRLPDLGEGILQISLVRTTSAYFKQRWASKQ